MSLTLAVLATCFVPHGQIIVEHNGQIELNHIVSVSVDPWGGWQVSETRYWLGRRAIEQCDDVWVVDWWRRYDDERPWLLSPGVLLQLRSSDGMSQIVRARAVRHFWTDYDAELVQRRNMEVKYNVSHTLYRRGLGRCKPQ